MTRRWSTIAGLLRGGALYHRPFFRSRGALLAVRGRGMRRLLWLSRLLGLARGCAPTDRFDCAADGLLRGVKQFAHPLMLRRILAENVRDQRFHVIQSPQGFFRFHRYTLKFVITLSARGL